MRRRRVGAVLADVLAGGEHGALGGVGLRRQRQVDRGLGERELALRQPDVLDRVGRRGGHDERLRVGVADVLGGEHDHPAHDEARILAALEHHRQVVQRGVGVGAARGLDPGRDRVVVAVGLAVVEQRPALERVLGVGERDRLAVAGRLAGELEAVQRRAGVAARRARRGTRAPPSRSRPGAALVARHRAVEQLAHVARAQARRARTRGCARSAPS